MKVLMIVPLVSRDGAFGGPVAVAIEQAQALRRNGEEVTLAAGWDGRPIGLKPSGTLNIRLFRCLRIAPGLTGLVSLGLVLYAFMNLRKFDAVHIHAGRDLISCSVLVAVRMTRTKVVIQTHGMIMPDARSLVRALDRVLIRRALGAARCVIVLTETEAAGIRAVASSATIERLPNGISAGVAQGAKRDDDLVAFISRLHPRKNLRVFLEAAAIVSEQRERTVFEFYGPDEGSLADGLQFIADNPSVNVRYGGALTREGVIEVLTRASVFVLPSEGEVFPMAVLEALAAGAVPVVSDSCGIASDLEKFRAAVLVDSTPEAVSTGVLHVMSSRTSRERLVRGGRAALQDWLDIDRIARELINLYRGAPTTSRDFSNVGLSGEGAVGGRSSDGSV
ncbi:glycosyltransferase [Microbacterium sp. NPDC079995]|uniref:glycosyltransferase n=1 Tax=unclassified Microbacterium TaxID=2609290 RepID=UPI00344D523D